MYYQSPNKLFLQGDLSHVLERQKEEIKEYINSIPETQFLNTSIDELAEHVISKFEITPIEIYVDQQTMEQKEAKIDISYDRMRNIFGNPGPMYVNGIQITISTPYSGTKDLWYLKPNKWRSDGSPQANIKPIDQHGIGSFDIIINHEINQGVAEIKQKISNEISKIQFYLNAQKELLTPYNTQLTGIVRQAITDRRHRLNKNNDIASAIGIPLKRKSDAPKFVPIDVQRKLVKPLPSLSMPSAIAEPGICDNDYEHMLSVIRHAGKTFESTPKTYKIHDEEELRDIILAHLNGHYEGKATGETFRKNGKTDIRIEDNNRAAFVAECKVWYGTKRFVPTIDQLLSYLTWRDCKASIVVFNKDNKDILNVQKEMSEALSKHGNMLKYIGQIDHGEWSYIFTSKEDNNLTIKLRVFLFNIYAQ